MNRESGAFVQSSETSDHRQSEPKDRAGFWGRFWRVVVVTAVLLFLEHSTFNWVLGLHEWEISFVGLFYQPLLKAGFPKWTPLFTTILRVDSPETQTGPQAIRRTLEQILPRILDASPAAIVLDCTLQKDAGGKETERLIDMIHRACGRTRIVLGFDLEKGAIADHLDIWTREKSYCDMGYTNGEEDFRLLPLFRQIGDQKYRSLSYAAARLVDPQLADTAVIRESWQTGRRLYTGLLRVSDYRDYLITDQELLQNPVTPQPVKEKIAGRIVIVGFSRREPELETAVGAFPSHLLQATYVEAFRGRRVLREAEWWLHWSAAIVFWAYVAFASGFGQTFVRICKGLLGLLVVDLCLVQVFSQYNEFVLISVLGLCLWALSHVHLRLHKHTHGHPIGAHV